MSNEMGTMCSLCQAWYERYPLINGQHILDAYNSMGAVRCAFFDGVFSQDNWNCQTMSKLRKLAGEDKWISTDGQDGPYFHAWYRWDDNAGSIGTFAIPEEVAFASGEMQCGYLVMTWYKSRGTTGNAWVMEDEEEPQKLTLRTAEAIIAHFQRKQAHETEQVQSGQDMSPLIAQYIKHYPTWIPKQEEEQTE